MKRFSFDAEKLPAWFRQEIPGPQCLEKLRLINQSGLHTVCQEAKCPNLAKCFKDQRLTFLILGDTCTRLCGFCAVAKSDGRPLSLDHNEPAKIKAMVKELGLKYVVITSVTRDDLADGGAAQFAQCIELIRQLKSEIKIEILVPDFSLVHQSLDTVIKAGPDIFAHNLETVKRLYTQLKPRCNYEDSLGVLEYVKKAACGLTTKSSLMLGLGEGEDEVVEAMHDLRGVNCDILTLGQYLSPGRTYFAVKVFISIEKFKDYERIGKNLGFKRVVSGPIVRSSYQAELVDAVI